MTDSAPGILVVDDDPALLAFLQIALPRKGFVVWPAPSGQVAVDLYQRARDKIDLVLLDVRMPGLDGPQTLAQLRRINPDVPCCFMSGHTGSYTTEQLYALGALHFFDKPFRVDEFAHTLWQCVRPAAVREQ